MLHALQSVAGSTQATLSEHSRFIVRLRLIAMALVVFGIGVMLAWIVFLPASALIPLPSVHVASVQQQVFRAGRLISQERSEEAEELLKSERGGFFIQLQQWMSDPANGSLQPLFELMTDPARQLYTALEAHRVARRARDPPGLPARPAACSRPWSNCSPASRRWPSGSCRRSRRRKSAWRSVSACWRRAPAC